MLVQFRAKEFLEVIGLNLKMEEWQVSISLNLVNPFDEIKRLFLFSALIHNLK